MLTAKKPMLNYINVFRGLAIILILTGHTLQIGREGSLARAISFEIFTGGTTLFVFISGYLFEYLSYKFEYKNYLAKKWQNVLLPYVLTAIPGVAACLLIPDIYHNPFDGLNPLAQIGIFLTTGRIHNVPTWFIPMITIFFILSRLLLQLKEKGLLYKLLPVLILITVLFPRGDIEPEWVMGFDYLGRYLAYIKYVLIGFVHFASSYVLGMYFATDTARIRKFYKYKVHLLVFMVLAAVADIFLNYNFQIANGTVSKLLFAVAALTYLEKYDAAIISKPKLNAFMNRLAKYSFGLFFIHWYLIFLFNYFLTPLVDGSSVPVVLKFLFAFLRFIMVFCVSFLTLYLYKIGLKKIGIKNTRSFIGV